MAFCGIATRILHEISLLIGKLAIRGTKLNAGLNQMQSNAESNQMLACGQKISC